MTCSAQAGLLMLIQNYLHCKVLWRNKREDSEKLIKYAEWNQHTILLFGWGFAHRLHACSSFNKSESNKTWAFGNRIAERPHLHVMWKSFYAVVWKTMTR